MMKKIIISLIVLISLPVFSQQGNKNFIDQAYIEVNGKAELEVNPNEIYIRIRIVEDELKTKMKLEKLEENMIQKLNKMGIDTKKDLAVVDFNTNLEDYFLKKKEVIASKEYELLLHSGAKVAQVYKELEKTGITDIRIDRTDHSQIEKFRKEVKINAVKAAKEKAKYLTEAIDQNIGKAIFIQELQAPVYYRQNMNVSNIAVRGLAEDDASFVPELEFEKIKLEYTVLVKFILE